MLESNRKSAFLSSLPNPVFPLQRGENIAIWSDNNLEKASTHLMFMHWQDL